MIQAKLPLCPHPCTPHARPCPATPPCTQLPDIEAECAHYAAHFAGKTIYCNCDDPRVSQFWHYFSHNFAHFGLRRLIATCYKSRNPDMFTRHDSERAVMLDYTGFRAGDVVPRPEDIGLRLLDGDGDFRSPECIDLLRQADIVVTNPPFSLFREYLAQLVEHNKQFLIIGNMNAITYKEVFPLIRDNRLWLGFTGVRARSYGRPDGTDQAFGNTCWFTNLPHRKRNEELILWKTYSPEEFPAYDNYDAIEVSKVAHIPADYLGAMGVPVTFLDKYNPEQFEILGMDRPLMLEKTGKVSRFFLNGKEIYARLLIRNRHLAPAG